MRHRHRAKSDSTRGSVVFRRRLWLAWVGAGVVVAAGLFVFGASLLFERRINREIEALLDKNPREPEIFEEAMLDGLPEPVQTYLRRAIPVGAPLIQTAYLRQTGRFRGGVDQPWMNFSADEYFNPNAPGFIWHANMTMPPGVPVAVRDGYAEGEGRTLVRLLSVVTMVDDGATPTMNEASLLRYLAEAVWMPTALLPNDNLRWDAVDAQHARVTLTHNAMSLSLTVTFDAEGDIIQLRGQRPWESGYEEWGGEFSDYRVMDGYRIPARGLAVWYFDDGDFPYADMTVVEASFS